MKKSIQPIIAVIISFVFIGLSIQALAQDIGSPDPEVLGGLYPGKTYSPCSVLGTI